MPIQTTFFPLSYRVMKHINQGFLVIFFPTFPDFHLSNPCPNIFVFMTPKHLRDDTFLDLVSYDYFQIIQLLKDSHVPIY